MPVWCGIDWAEDHHDVAVVNCDGRMLAKLRISDDIEGYQALLELLAIHGDQPEGPIPVAIETSRGLLVAALRATGRAVYAINPMAVARYRQRHTLSGKKSDHQDAMVLANILRTDAAVHRTLPADSALAQAVTVLARAQQDAVWDRTGAHNRLRSLLREYYPSIISAFSGKRDGLISCEARAVLAVAPTPARAARLTLPQLRSALKAAGRQRGIDAEAQRLAATFRRAWAAQPTAIEDAMGRHALALLKQLDAACEAASELAAAVEEVFGQHPDAAIITSFPGLGVITGARVLAEIGDDRTRFTDAAGLKAFAGSAPVTRASGRTVRVMHRRIKNNRLAAVGRHWAFSALTASPAARAHYDRRRDHGDRYAASLRHLFNKLIGQLHHCLQTGVEYREDLGFPTPATMTT